MTYTHLTTNELVTIEAYYQENIIKNHNQSPQDIYYNNTWDCVNICKGAFLYGKFSGLPGYSGTYRR